MEAHEPIPRASWTRLLLIMPFLAMLWVPSYNKIAPTLFDLPFFFWYQLLWVLLCSATVGVVYLVEKDRTP